MKDSCPAFDGIFDEIVENAGGDSEYLSFANLWNNANYPRFIEEACSYSFQKESSLYLQ